MTMRWAAAIVVLASLGCDRQGNPQPRRETPAELALRKKTEQVLEEAKTMTLTSWGPIPDGGSWVFGFQTDKGADVNLQLHHANKRMGGNTVYQEFRIFAHHPSVECEVEPGSKLESLLVEHLHGAKHAVKDDFFKPTVESLPWLQRRLVDRTIPFDAPPHSR